METKDRYIVAVDLGTSKIALTVARIEGENTQIVYFSLHTICPLYLRSTIL